jgi:hypothetical protein
MTDVALGGATVFPALRLALWPKKGSAAFWHNLRRSGQGDYKTRHAGKWHGVKVKKTFPRIFRQRINNGK